MTDQKTTLGFYGAASMVTGSNFLVTVPSGGNPGYGAKIMIDCGLFQGGSVFDDKNHAAFPYDPTSVDVLLVTHAHLDHVGRIPKLIRDGFRGTIYSTPPTRDMARLILTDSMGVLRREAEEKGTKPLYDEDDVEKAMSHWQTKPYRQSFELPGGVSATLHDAGHILGSSMVELAHDGKTIVFSGDLGNSPAPLLHDTDSLAQPDYLVMESLYGDHEHEDRDTRKHILEDVIENTVLRGGALIIPAFSIERTQEVLAEINDLVEHKKIPEVPVFLDSPLAIKVTEIYKAQENDQYFNKTAMAAIASGDDIFKFPRLRFTLSRGESDAIAETSDPKIIMAGSGMSNGGRVLKHLKRHLADPKSTMLIVGYQAAGTMGRMIQDGAKEVTIEGEVIPVRAQITTIHGYSAHKDGAELLTFIEPAIDTLKKVFLVHGEPKALLFFAQRARDYLGLDASVPQEGEVFTIDF